jgi:hypothetical protein
MRTYTFEANGNSQTLKYGYNAICELEEASGKPLQELFTENVGLSTIRLLIWAGLKWKNNGITKQQVGFMLEELMDNGTFQDVGKKAVELLAESLGKGEQVGE